MRHSLRFMLLGIFLAVAAIWCLVAEEDNLFFAAAGFYILPIAAVICFLHGFFPEKPSNTPADTPENPIEPQE